MRFRSAIGEQILGEPLPGEGRGRERQGLGGCGLFSGNFAGGIARLLDGKERIAIRPVKEVDESLLGRLCNRIDFPAVASIVKSAGGEGKSRSHMS